MLRQMAAEDAPEAAAAELKAKAERHENEVSIERSLPNSFFLALLYLSYSNMNNLHGSTFVGRRLQRWAKRRALGCEKFQRLLSKTGPPF